MRILLKIVLWIICAAAIPLSMFAEPVIDVVIPTCSKDLEILNLCIRGVKENCKNVRRIIVVSPEHVTNEAEWFDEKNYPFTKQEIALYLNHMNQSAADRFLRESGRVGWYYQQLLKLYAAYVIPGIASNVLIVDSDTVFLRPVEFISPEGGGYFATGREYHQPYFAHAARFLPGLVRVYPDKSGVVHHMLFQRPILDELFDAVEDYHQVDLWKAFCYCVDLKHLGTSGASEYEIYFNFALSHSDEVSIRELKWKNSGYPGSINEHRREGYDYVSYHSYLR